MTMKRCAWVFGARPEQKHSSIGINFCYDLLCNHSSCVLLLLIINLHNSNIYICSGPQKNPRVPGSKTSSVQLLMLQLQWEV